MVFMGYVNENNFGNFNKNEMQWKISSIYLKNA